MEEFDDTSDLLCSDALMETSAMRDLLVLDIIRAFVFKDSVLVRMKKGIAVENVKCTESNYLKRIYNEFCNLLINGNLAYVILNLSPISSSEEEILRSIYYSRKHITSAESKIGITLDSYDNKLTNKLSECQDILYEYKLRVDREGDVRNNSIICALLYDYIYILNYKLMNDVVK